MVKKKKSKKQRKPNIPVQTMARPRLEQILARRRHGELDESEYVTSIKALMREISQEAVLNALVGLLDGADNEQRDALMVAIPKLGNAETIQHLWKLVRRSKISMGAKTAALVILKQMGEEVNLDDPTEYFSWRDIKQADISEIASMGRFSMRAIIKELQQVENVDEVETMMLHFGKILSQTGGEATAQAIVDDLVEMGDSDAADMLATFVATTPHPEVREAARRGLLKLSGQKVFPQSEIVKALGEDRFYVAYCTDPAHPWQQSIMTTWERSKDTVQVLGFLLDFGSPWQGAVKDVIVTQSISLQQFRSQFIDHAKQMGVEHRRVTYARARQFVLDALKANRKNRVKLPPEYDEFRHLIERRFIDPSPETLAHARQIDAQTVDEWGELAGEPIRGMEIIGPDGEPIPVMIGDLDDEDWEDEEYEFDFDDLLVEVDDYYTELAEELEAGETFILPHEWVVDYLTARFEEGIDEEELDHRWDDLSEFMFFLDIGDDTPSTLADIQDYQLSEFITEFWDENVEEEEEIIPVEEKQYVMETIEDLYTYLAAQGHVPTEAAQRVAGAVKTLFSRKDKVTPIHK